MYTRLLLLYYSCNAGYQLALREHGGSLRVCEANSRWNATASNMCSFGRYCPWFNAATAIASGAGTTLAKPTKCICEARLKATKCVRLSDSQPNRLIVLVYLTVNQLEIYYLIVNLCILVYMHLKLAEVVLFCAFPFGSPMQDCLNGKNFCLGSYI